MNIKIIVILLINTVVISSCGHLHVSKTGSKNRKPAANIVQNEKIRQLTSEFWHFLSDKAVNHSESLRLKFENILREIPFRKLDQLMVKVFKKDVQVVFVESSIEILLKVIGSSPENYYKNTEKSLGFYDNARLILNNDRASFGIRKEALISLKESFENLLFFLQPKDEFKKLTAKNAQNVLLYRNKLLLKDKTSELLLSVISSNSFEQDKVEQFVSKVISQPDNFNERVHYVVAKYLRKNKFVDIVNNPNYQKYFLNLLTMKNSSMSFYKHQLEAVYFLSSQDNILYFKELIDFPEGQDARVQSVISKKVSSYFYRAKNIPDFDHYLKLIIDRGLQISTAYQATDRAHMDLISFLTKYGKDPKYQKILADLRFQRYIRKIIEHGRKDRVVLVLKLISKMDNIDENMIKNLFYISKSLEFENQALSVLREKLSHTMSISLKNKYEKYLEFPNKLIQKDLIIPTYNCNHFISSLLYKS